MKRYAVLLLIVALLVGLTACGGDAPNDDFTQGAEVPTFVGMNYYHSVADYDKYDHYHLKIIEADAGDDRYEGGYIFKQEPKPGSFIEDGESVTLYIHAKVDEEIMLGEKISIVGRNKDDMRKMLQCLGFRVTIEYIQDGTQEKDCVERISITPGQNYPFGTPVTIYVCA